MIRARFQLRGIKPTVPRVVACVALACPAFAAAQDTGMGVDTQFGTRHRSERAGAFWLR